MTDDDFVSIKLVISQIFRIHFLLTVMRCRRDAAATTGRQLTLTPQVNWHASSAHWHEKDTNK
ncbi:hypothetical protein J6590_036196 [Homalodisca vitripennis]|nr:hypothetical protein J6590_036196 [Homalodisca vitripennis]